MAKIKSFYQEITDRYLANIWVRRSLIVLVLAAVMVFPMLQFSQSAYWVRVIGYTGLYILLGLVGVPVFSGFTGGVSKLAGATGGYIVGYIPMVALAGFLMSKSDKWWLHLLAMVAGEVVLYLIGTVWFCVQAGKTASAALAICVYPFIPLDIVKMVIVVLIGPMISSRLKKAHLNV